jgi:holo-[acyl-carrier protein] synthase
MLYGIGCDLCSLSHLEKSLSSAHAAAFVRRVYGPAEQAALGLLEASPAPLNAHRLAAADFAAKEAFLKAAGTGLREPFSLCEIEAVRQENGAPAYRFSGQTAAWVAQHRLRARLSLSHEGGMALAFCTLEEES